MPKSIEPAKPEWTRRDVVEKKKIPAKICWICKERKIYAGTYFAGTAKVCPFCGSPV
jgi:hypothetical protein